MGLEVITAAVEAAALAEKQLRLEHAEASPERSRSLLSDSTEPDDPCESDSSTPGDTPSPPATTKPANSSRSVVPTSNKAKSTSKKRRADSVSKPQQKKVASLMPNTVADSFPAEMLLDLAGSTSAEVRRMNEDERALVHYKRRLRNRESAKRSRARRQATINDIQNELEDLREVTASLVDRCVSFARTNDKQSRELEILRKEKQLLESMLRSGGGGSV